MGKKIAGTCFVKVDGTQLTIKGSIEVPANEFKRENVMGLNGSAGYKETATPQYVKGTFLVTRDFPLQQLRDGTGMTITAELSNGFVYTLSGAWLDGDPVIKAEDGEIDLEFHGLKGLFQ